MIDPAELTQQQADQGPTAPDQTGIEAVYRPRIRPQGPGIFTAPGADEGQGGGMDMNTLMPFLMLAAPFLEARNPGYGVGLVQGIQNYTRQRATENQNKIIGFAHEFANVSDEDWPAAEGLLKAAGLRPAEIQAVKAGRIVGRDPNYEIHRQVEKILGPGAAVAREFGVQYRPTTEQVTQLQQAGLPTGGFYNAPVQTGVTPGAPGERQGPIERGPAVPPQPIMGREVRREGEKPVVTYGDILPKTQGTMIGQLPITEKIPERMLAPYLPATPEETRQHQKDYQAYLREKLDDALRNPGAHSLPQLKAQMEGNDPATGDPVGLNFSAEVSKAADRAAKADAARPVYVQAGGQTFAISQDKAYAEAVKNDGTIMVPAYGMVVRMTPKEFVAYQTEREKLGIEQRRLGTEEANRPTVFSLQGVRIRNESDFKTAVLTGAIDPKLLTPDQRALAGIDPKQAPTPAQVATWSHTANTGIAVLQTQATRLPAKYQDLIQNFINGKDQKKLDALTSDTSAEGAAALKIANGIVAFQAELRELEKYGAKPGNTPRGSPPPMVPAQFKGQTVQGPDGSRWSSDGATWTPVP